MLANFLLPFSLLYRLIISVRSFLFQWGAFKREAFSVPIISVGNLVVGGAGKTPCSLELVKILKKKDKKILVVYRGYKRTSEESFLEVELDKGASHYGDEAYLMKFLNPDVKVYVGSKRREVIREALKTYPEIEVVLLDDAFQHRAVKRDLDICLIDASEEKSHYKLLPSGRMREPWSALKRSNLLVLSKTNMASGDLQWVESKVKKIGLSWNARFSYEIIGFQSLADWEAKQEHLQKDMPVKDFNFISGLAKPKQLLKALEKKKYSVHPIYKEDHYDFVLEDFRLLKGETLVSEKDAIKIKDLDIDHSKIWVVLSEVKWSDDGEKINAEIGNLFS